LEAKRENAILRKSFEFAVRIAKLNKKLKAVGEHVLSKQLLRSGTSIGANVEEAQAAQSRMDFHAKLVIASKEANETRYWLRVLKEADYQVPEIKVALADVDEVIRLLAAITKKTKTAI